MIDMQIFAQIFFSSKTNVELLNFLYSFEYNLIIYNKINLINLLKNYALNQNPFIRKIFSFFKKIF